MLSGRISLSGITFLFTIFLFPSPRLFVFESTSLDVFLDNPMSECNEELAIERLSEFSSFNSCIRYYGRSILPPVLSSCSREELNQIRARACQKESEINKKKEENVKLFNKVQELYNKIEEHLNSSEVALPDGSVRRKNSETNDQVPPNTPQPTRESKKAGHDLKLIDCENEEARDSRPSSAFRNLLLDNAESFCSNPDSGIKQLIQHPGSCFPGSVFLPQNSSIPVHNSNVCLVSYNDTLSSSYAESCAGSEISDDQKASDDAEAECLSLATVILNTYETLGCDLDVASTITSAARSSDLDNYMDLSTEDVSLSNVSTVISGSESQSTLTAILTSNEHTPVAEQQDESLICDKEEVRKQKNGQEEVDLSDMQPESAEQNCKSTSKFVSANRPTKLDLRGSTSNTNDSCAVSGGSFGNHDCLLEIASKNSSADVLCDECPRNEAPASKVLSGSATDLREKNDAMPRPGHVRRHSYTLDHPSPVLLSSHAGCKCNSCPGAQMSPHSSSSDFDKLLLTPPSPFISNENFHSARDSSAIVPCMQIEPKTLHPVDHGKATEVSIIASGNGPFNLSNGNTDPMELTKTLGKRCERIKEVHKRKVEKLLAEQHEQWMKLQAEYKEQERLLREEIEFLKLIDGNDVPADLHIQKSTEITDVPAVEVGSGYHHNTFKCSESSPSAKAHQGSAHHPKKINPFTSRSPAVKASGSLQCKPIHNLLRSRSCDITPSKKSSESSLSSQRSLSLKSNDFPKEMPPLMLFGVRQKPLSLKTVKAQGNKLGPLKAVTPITIAKSYASKKLGKLDKETRRLFAILNAVNDPAMQRKFEKVSAHVKGYLTRRLLQTDHLQRLISTVHEAANLFVKCEREAKAKSDCGISSAAEEELGHRLLKQINTASEEINRIFFELSPKERMAIISKSREAIKERQTVTKKFMPSSRNLVQTSNAGMPVVSVATLRSMERKRLKAVLGDKDVNIEYIVKNMPVHKLTYYKEKRLGICKSASPQNASENAKPCTPERRSNSTGIVNARARHIRRSLN